MADELREDKQSINHKVLIPFQTDRFIESDKQLSFNVGYLFLQRIFYQLGLPSICRKIKKDNSFDYDLSDMKFFDDYLISFRRKEKEIEKELDYCGYFVLVSSEKMTAEEALTKYRHRDASEKQFLIEKSFLGGTVGECIQMRLWKASS